MGDNVLKLVVIGRGCILYNDPEKAVEVENGKTLVPWCQNNSFLIDRFDARGYLVEICEPDSYSNVKSADTPSEDEIAIEKLCEFERYLEMNVDVHEMEVEIEETAKRDLEKQRNLYGAVSFTYDESTTTNSNENETNSPKESVPDEVPYNLPPELQFLSHLIIPESDKQAQVIEKTAVFVSRQGNQMEIILKAKQKNNPLFSFLNYDHELNPFYKEVVSLICQNRYVPKPRTSVEQNVVPQPEIENSESDDTYELKLPKVDISNTAYAALINKFKKVNEAAAALAVSRAESNEQVAQPSDAPPCPSEEATQSPTNLDSSEHNQNNEDPIIDTANPAVMPTSNCTDQIQSKNLPNTVYDAFHKAEYERYYQEYYRHYYSYYYSELSKQKQVLTDVDCANIVQEAAKAAAIAAAAALDVIKRSSQSQPVEPVMTAEERGIIDKMAEYVVRNGLEFEELVTKQKMKDARFSFLKPDHPFHTYYMAKRREFDPDDSLTRAADAAGACPSPPKRSMDDQPSSSTKTRGDERSRKHNRSKRSPSNHNDTSASAVDQSSISFRLSRPTKPNGDPNAVPVGNGHSPTVSKRKKRRDDQRSCIIPGIPSFSSSSSSSSSSASPSPSPTSSRHSSLSPRNSDSPDRINIVSQSYDDLKSPSPSSSRLNSPLSPRCTSPMCRDGERDNMWGSCNLDDLLDIHEPTSLLDLSTDGGYHSANNKCSENKHLQNERRRRVAELMHQLELTNSIVSTSSSTTTKSTSSTSGASLKYAPPAPDSVSVLVARDIVKSLKHRSKDTAIAHSSKKSRKRKRSPPAAYATLCNRLPEKSSKDSPRRRNYTTSEDDHRSKTDRRYLYR